MLIDFAIEQKKAYKMMLNIVDSNKIGHAYIIESNGYSKALDLAKAFSKAILCPNRYSKNDKCGNCSQCLNIDKNEFMELKIIDSDGMWIKKSELDELQDIFSKKPIMGNDKVYIINDANKLNESSSNSLLKFLEEPEEGIVAILIVENTNLLLKTIVSRCQVISLFPNDNLIDLSTVEKVSHYLKNSDEDIKNYIESGNCEKAIEDVINFIVYYEKNHYNTIIYMNKLWHQNFKERGEIIDAFKVMVLFYKDVLNIVLGRKILIFNDYLDFVNEIVNLNEKNTLIYKINVIMDLQEKIKYNANINLLMDKLVIDLERSV